MNLINKLFAAGLGLGLLLSCDSTDENSSESKYPDNFWIEGTIEGAINARLYVEASTQDGVIDIVNGETDSKGHFELTGNIPGMGLYEFRMGETQQNILPLTLQPGDKLKLKATKETFSTKPKFMGTDWAIPLSKYMEMFNVFSMKQAKFTQENQGLGEEQMIAKYLEFRDPIDRYAKEQINKEPGNPVNIILTSSLSPSMGFEKWDADNLTILKKVQTAYLEKFKDSPLANRMGQQVTQIEMAYQQYLQTKDQDKAGELAPEIAMQSPEGKIIRLSDLKGKYVLIDFWASWCGPCRRENPNVVRLYNQYKSKGFTVFSVSLDNDGEKWKSAILQDGLVWPYHVSDLLGWNTPMTQVYGFNSIPHTVLIDPQGKVIAKNLRGESLEQKLKELL
jgi:thiol-disulfide isomerase/thioredoxin